MRLRALQQRAVAGEVDVCTLHTKSFGELPTTNRSRLVAAIACCSAHVRSPPGATTTHVQHIICKVKIAQHLAGCSKLLGCSVAPTHRVIRQYSSVPLLQGCSRAEPQDLP